MCYKRKKEKNRYMLFMHTSVWLFLRVYVLFFFVAQNYRRYGR